MAHAYFVAARAEDGIAAALSFGERELGLSSKGNPDVVTLQYSLFPVEDARKVGELVSRAPLRGTEKLIVIAAERLFHEAQNALLKVFEEPTPGTTLILVVPSEGIILPTLRSRLMQLPGTEAGESSPLAKEFLDKPAARADVVAAILKRASSDKQEEKQAARRDARELLEGIMRTAYAAHRARPTPELAALLLDLDRFMPIMFERAAPLKPILEHISMVFPDGKR